MDIDRIFAYLCKAYGVKDEWLKASKSCLDFMENYCINKNAGRRMYFTVTADGKPVEAGKAVKILKVDSVILTVEEIQL